MNKRDIKCQNRLCYYNIRLASIACFTSTLWALYTLMRKKCKGGNIYVLPIIAKFNQSTRRFGRISFARLLKFNKNNTVLVYLLSIHLLPCVRDCWYKK